MLRQKRLKFAWIPTEVWCPSRKEIVWLWFGRYIELSYKTYVNRILY